MGKVTQRNLVLVKQGALPKGRADFPHPTKVVSGFKTAVVGKKNPCAARARRTTSTPRHARHLFRPVPPAGFLAPRNELGLEFGPAFEHPLRKQWDGRPSRFKWLINASTLAR